MTMLSVLLVRLLAGVAFITGLFTIVVVIIIIIIIQLHFVIYSE